MRFDNEPLQSGPHWPFNRGMYHQLAHLYDWSGSLDFAEQTRLRLLPRLQEAGIPPGEPLIDLACGTGTLAIALAEAGYRVTGIDVSEPMLAQAQGKARALPPDVQARLHFEAGDMRFFEVAHPVAAVLCHYDSLNHLSNESELRAVFFQVSQSLRADGLFVFDLNTLENYRTFWQGTDSDEGPNYRLSTEARFDEATGKAEVRFTADEHTEQGLVRRSESLREQYFNEAAVEKYLQAAGFYDIAMEPFNPVSDLPPDLTLKTWWQARRRPD